MISKPGELNESYDQPWGGYGKSRGGDESAAASFSVACSVGSASRSDEMTSDGLCALIFLSLVKLRKPG